MPRARVLVFVLAGGKGSRLELLTRERAKPAVSFGGTHRLIDFPLSNCLNSGLNDVWVAQQFNPVSLSDHLSNGRPWDLDRTTGGLLLLNPRLGHDDRTGFQGGTADVLWHNAPLIRDFDPEVLVAMSADAVYTLDYGAVVEHHREAGATVTMVTTEVEPGSAGRYGVVQADGERIEDYAYKPDEPEGDLVTNEVFAFTAGPLLEALEELGADAGEEGLDDLGDELLPRFVAAGDARQHRLEGYWRDVGTIPAYWQCHQDLLAEEPPIDLDDPAWPILTRAAAHRAAGHVLAGADVERSLVAPASRVGGRVRGSIVGRGACVEPGAVVEDSVLLPGTLVRAGAEVRRAVLDDGVEVCGGGRVGEAEGDIALVGLRARIEDGQEVPAGGRFPEVEDD